MKRAFELPLKLLQIYPLKDILKYFRRISALIFPQYLMSLRRNISWWIFIVFNSICLLNSHNFLKYEWNLIILAQILFLIFLESAPFRLLISLHITSWKHQKISYFLMFTRRREKTKWNKMVYRRFSFPCIKMLWYF